MTMETLNQLLLRLPIGLSNQVLYHSSMRYALNNAINQVTGT